MCGGGEWGVGVNEGWGLGGGGWGVEGGWYEPAVWGVVNNAVDRNAYAEKSEAQQSRQSLVLRPHAKGKRAKA